MTVEAPLHGPPVELLVEPGAEMRQPRGSAPGPAAPPPDRPIGNRLREHLRVPLFRNAYALIGSTLLMTGLGLLASLAAARLYSPEDFGRGQSTINAIILLGGLGNLRLMNVLTRFLPRARERSSWLVTRCYLLVVTASLVACAVYLTALSGVLPVEELMGDTPYGGLWLTITVVVFALFTVQDAVLTGLREATWVPIKNGVHGVAKLALVIALAGIMPATGILTSWAVPTLLALLPVNLLITRRLLPANARRDIQPEDLSPRRLAPFAAGEYAGALCELAVANLIPLIILARLGAEAAGYFAVAWLIGTTLDHIVMHFGASLTVEGASDPEQLPSLTRTLLRRSAVVIGPISAVVVVGGPLVLLPFGGDFASEAGDLLRLLGLSLFPRLVCIVAVVMARVRNNVPRLVGIQALLAAGSLVGSSVLLGPLGIAGPGVAYLVTSILVALMVSPRLVVTLRQARHLARAGRNGNGHGPDGNGRRAAALTAGTAGLGTMGDPNPNRPVEPQRPSLDGVTVTAAPPAQPRALLPQQDFSHPSLPQREFTAPPAIPQTRPAPADDGPRHLARPHAHRDRRLNPTQLLKTQAQSWAAGYRQVVPLGISVILAAISFVQIDRADTGGALGLAAAMPVTWWLAAVALTAGFTWLVFAGPAAGPRPGAGAVSARRWVLLAHVAALVVLLHATPGLVETHGRFPTAWTHVGFVDHIIETGGVDPGYDGRYNWPGAFSFGAFLTELTGADSARALVRFAPVLMNFLLLTPVALILRHVTKDQRLRWIALWLFVVTNWIGQDYLAPQPVALLGYLVVTAVLLRWFRWADVRAVSAVDLLGRLRRRVPRLTRDDRLPQSAAPPPAARAGQAFGLVVIITAIGASLAFSHQLTPFMLVIAAAILVVAGRVDRPSIPLLLAVCAVAWASLGATSYLHSHLEELTSSVGDIGGVVEDNQSRVSTETDMARQLVLAIRLGVMALVLGLAGLGLWRQWRARRADWGLAGLAVAPLTLVWLNSYGGEILLRISLFALPFLALLGAFAFLREESSPRVAWRGGVAFFLLAVLLVPLFMIARYGNEAYERIYSEDIAAWDYVVDHAPPGATVVVPDFAGPWRYHSLRQVEYRLYADEVDDQLAAEPLDRFVEEAQRRPGQSPGGLTEDGVPAYLILGTASARFREIAEGYPDSWQDQLVDDLLATGDYELVFEAGETRVLARAAIGPTFGDTGDEDSSPGPGASDKAGRPSQPGPGRPGTGRPGTPGNQEELKKRKDGWQVISEVEGP